MKESELVAPVIEPIVERYERELLELKDDRKVRGFDYESEERRSRRYVDPDTIEVTVDAGDPDDAGFVGTDITVTGTVSDRHDNDPVGHDQEAFEDNLVYDPNNPTGA
jgi:hypothetical protein